MIPKKIHYCWMSSDPYPDLVVRCMDSWHRFMPDYELCRWDYSRFPRGKSSFVDAAYDCHKYAFCGDYLRLYALYTQGGIYMDTDVEVLRPLDELLNLPYFIGFEADNYPEMAVLGFQQSDPIIRLLLSSFVGQRFNTETLPKRAVRCLADKKIPIVPVRGIDTFNSDRRVFSLFPMHWFCGKHWRTRRIYATADSYTQHHYMGSWL